MRIYNIPPCRVVAVAGALCAVLLALWCLL